MEGLSELEVSYHRELKQNYLMIAAEEGQEQSFEARMLAENFIEGMLRFRIRREDEKCWFCYEITSRQPLERLLEGKSIGAEQIRALLLGIAGALMRMGDYLLAEEQILLNPQYIYVSPDDYQPGLCLLPGRKGDFPRQFSDFLQFLLGKADHQDRDAVVLIYGLYRESLKENYGLDNLLRWLTGENKPREQYEEEKIFPAGAETEERETPRGAFREMERGTVRGTSRVAERGTIRGKSREAEREADRGTLREADGDTRRRKTLFSLRQAGSCVLLPLFLLAALWLWRGVEGIKMYGFLAAVCGMGAALLVLLLSARAGGKRQNSSRKKGEWAQGPGGTESWEIMFSEDGSGNGSGNVSGNSFGNGSGNVSRNSFGNGSGNVSGNSSGSSSEPPDERFSPRAGEASPDSHTVLLWSGESSESVRSLVGQDGTTDVIPIAYYPFLIGKQENLTDYAITRDTISRLHVRLDRKEGGYWLTDLNSTNGTAVNGRSLEANETVPIRVGDRIDLADMHFHFQ